MTPSSKFSWHDCPRVVLVEENALRKIHDGSVEPSTTDKDGTKWLEILHEIATAYFAGRREAIEVIASPVGN